MKYSSIKVMYEVQLQEEGIVSFVNTRQEKRDLKDRNGGEEKWRGERRNEQKECR